MRELRFTGNFTQQEPIPEDAITRAVAIMQGGRLHRYNVAAGEESEAALLEKEFAQYLGCKYCLACTSGGYSLQIALRAFGIKAGESVLTNAFTLSPVPGAIHGVGAIPDLVETSSDLVIDLDHLQHKIENGAARVLMLSHMRGHIVNMDKLLEVLADNSIALIEDCAHTMGAFWNGKPSGCFGLIACFSTQTYKHINSGEGGFLTTNDADLLARATILSGSYMLYDRHISRPAEIKFDIARYEMPNLSGRMDNLRAAILRPQLKQLDANCRRWNKLYDALSLELKKSTSIRLTKREPQENFVGSSLQFFIDHINEKQCVQFVSDCFKKGVELKWFGAAAPAGYTSGYASWRYFKSTPLPLTDKTMATLFDLRLPLTFTRADCELIGKIIVATAPSHA